MIKNEKEIYDHVIKNIDTIISDLSTINFSSIKRNETYFSVGKYKIRYDDYTNSIYCLGRNFSFEISPIYIQFEKNFGCISLPEYQEFINTVPKNDLHLNDIDTEEKFFQYSLIRNFGVFEFSIIRKCYHLLDSIESFFWNDQETRLRWECHKNKNHP